MRRWAMAVCAAMMVAAIGVAAQAATAPVKRCFGAAARDPEGTCRHPHASRTVTPTPSKAEITPNVGCTQKTINEVLEACIMGASADSARATIAVAGDSHAQQWRSAFKAIGRSERWRVLEFAYPHCLF